MIQRITIGLLSLAAFFVLPSYASATTNNPLFSTQWGLWNEAHPGQDIGAPLAWQYSTGLGVTVAVVDDGITSSHPDLQNQFAANDNPGEIPGNGIDDDQNGYIDDTNGWDFGRGDNDPSPENPAPGSGQHGTHVAGIIAATNNNIGVVGVAPGAQLMSLKVYGSNDSEAVMAAALNYAGDMGVKVVNTSMYIPGQYPPLAVRQAISNHPNTLYVFAAGNDSYKIFAEGVSGTHSFPCSFSFSNMLCVGATGRRDLAGETKNPEYGCSGIYANDCLINISNYSDKDGPVQVYAPGGEINSTVPPVSDGGVGYEVLTGTSMAAPMVSGIAALLFSAHPDWTPSQVKQRIVDTSDLAARNWRLTDGNSEKMLPRANAGWALSGEPDHDRDAVLESQDNCPAIFNPNQLDHDLDGVGNVCDPTPDGPDVDHDGIGQLQDNCPTVFNPRQENSDHQGLGDACAPTILLRWSSKAHNVKRTITGKVWSSASSQLTVLLYIKQKNRWHLSKVSHQNIRRGDNLVSSRVRPGTWLLIVKAKGAYGKSSNQRSKQLTVA